MAQTGYDVLFMHGGKPIEGRITDAQNLHSCATMKVEGVFKEFVVQEIEAFTAEYFSEPLPQKISYEKDVIRKEILEERPCSPTAARWALFFENELSISLNGRTLAIHELKKNAPSPGK